MKNNHKYALLAKSVYGLHQAAKDWYKTQDRRMSEFDKRIQKSKSDPGVYYLVKTSAGGGTPVFGVW